jgi:hypothetical protein
MKAILLAFMSFWAMSAASASIAKAADCSEAERSLTKPFASWREAHGYYERFSGKCSDGALAEALSAQFTQLLSKRWERLTELEQLAYSDPKFLEWVLLGIYYDPDEVEINTSSTACRILNRLQSCQPSQKSLCARLSTRVGPNLEYIRACGA